VSNVDLVTSFYEAFARRDAEAMVLAYAEDVVFNDPVFRDLHGERAKGMWRMLCERGADLEIEFRDVQADADSGSAHWEARYTFTQTGRKVHNAIDATFTFRDGKIATHSDAFDLWRWSGMALGLPGKLLGWSPLLQGAIRKNAGKALDAYLAKR
jgi:ketosteroid isomerase-like protein